MSSHCAVKFDEATQMLVMVDCVRKMTMKESFMYCDNGSFEYLLFLLCFHEGQMDACFVDFSKSALSTAQCAVPRVPSVAFLHHVWNDILQRTVHRVDRVLLDMSSFIVKTWWSHTLQSLFPVLLLCMNFGVCCHGSLGVFVDIWSTAAGFFWIHWPLFWFWKLVQPQFAFWRFFSD